MTAFNTLQRAVLEAQEKDKKFVELDLETAKAIMTQLSAVKVASNPPQSKSSVLGLH